ncbi:LacI family DNA-binding transcriptional regulator [Pseudomonas putida]|uniref:LacI family DNA-binding transcriptional regulator n=1 Tax=Pseudomonas putida TaxID=303 RepID=A0A7D5VVB4_PSEPU|nr:LacI family DNA-binding transcriptional regulator [Pseudomonas putida]QLJ12605.1 LacI family DNA-binding transcriptional regulator [Pseudomonas putida]
MKKVSVKDVAQAAGVSVATVSRAYNLPDKVRDDVREKVIGIAERMGYSPNPAAQALRRQRSHTIGVVIPSLNYAIFARLVESFQEVLVAAGYNVLVLTTGYDNHNMFGPVKRLIDRGIDGLMVVGQIFDEGLRQYIVDRKLPCVTSYSYTDDPLIPSIGFDNFEATKKIVEHLIKMGHTHISMFAGPSHGNDRQQERIRAFNETLTTHGLLGNAVIVEREYTDAARQGAEALKIIRSERPDTTAIVCNSDVFAFSIISECIKLGICVPDEMSVAGFDDDSYTSLFNPPLTTVAVPATELGKHAAREMLNALTHRKQIMASRFETHLIVRESTSTPFIKANA